MSFEKLVTVAQKIFPDLKIKYKDQSLLMKIIGTLMFFNKDFMKAYTTTIGSTVYYPSQHFVDIRQVSSSVILLHELVHIKDANKISKPLFGFLYLTPQIFALLCIPLFLLSWKMALPLMIFFLLPLPAYFRMKFEKKAYLTSLYCMHSLGILLKFNELLLSNEQGFLHHFRDSTYYWMWPFTKTIRQDFDLAVIKIKNGERPFEDPFFDELDDLIKTI